MPSLVKLPDAMSLRQALAPKEVLSPTWAEWNTHYGVDAREVRIRGEELMTVEGREDAGRRVKVPKLQYLPRAWAPYFFGGVTPDQDMRLVRQLTRNLETVSQKEVAAVRRVVCPQRNRWKSACAQQELHRMGVACGGFGSGTHQVEGSQIGAIHDNRGSADDGSDVPAYDGGARRGCSAYPGAGGSGV